MLKSAAVKQAGVAAVEFAIILPVLIFILFALIDFSIMLYDKAVITNASREGARAGVVANVNQTGTGTATAFNVACSYMAAHLISFGSGTYTADCSTNPAVTAVNLGTGLSGTPLSVTVTYTYAGLGIMANTLAHYPVTATTVMNYE